MKDSALALYKNCRLCPRNCGVDRAAGQRGYCGESSELRVAYAGIHRGEEPPVTGKGGSGTVFVSGCNLGCVFCQNYQISRGNNAPRGGSRSFQETNKNLPLGRAVSPEEFADICLALEREGGENINIVTASHAVPAVALGIENARKKGLSVPVLWNSSGYEGKESLEILRDFVDVYLPDLKTLDSSFSARFFNAPDYPAYAARAIIAMMGYREPVFKDETMISGVIIRHLVIPGYLDATRQVLAWFSGNCRGRALLSLMTQYTPVGGGSGTDVPGSYLSEDDYEKVLLMLDDYDIDDGFCQELLPGSDWLPDFTRQNPFSSELSRPIWHFEK